MHSICEIEKKEKKNTLIYSFEYWLERIWKIKRINKS